MMKSFLVKCLSLLVILWGGMCNHDAFAAVPVAVMNFGICQGTAAEAMTVDDGISASAYIINRLVESKKFDVVDKILADKQIADEGLVTSGVIDADSAKRIGELLGVRYVIYGNILDVGLDSIGGSYHLIGLDNNKIISHINLRLMDVETGKILTVVKGEGDSSAACVKAKVMGNNFIKIGNIGVSMDAVHNAVQKAAFDAVDKLIQKNLKL